jgi:cysteine sulfinate desulfinase/cysteine desulfurase-like protein
VLEAMGLGEASGSSIRVSLGPGTTIDEVEAFVRVLERVVDRARASASGVPQGRRA